MSGFPGRGVDLWGGPGNFWGSAGNFRGSWETSREALKIHREKFRGSLRETPGSSGKFWQVQGLLRSSGEPDSPPATRQKCLQGCYGLVSSRMRDCRVALAGATLAGIFERTGLTTANMPTHREVRPCTLTQRATNRVWSKRSLVDVSDIFYFFCSGEGKGESRATGRGGVGFLLKITGGGGESGRGQRGPRVSTGNWGGGVNIFFRGRNVHQGRV